MNFYLKPVNHALVRDPSTGELLSAEGATKPQTAYWLRRLRDGDVVEVAPPESPAAPKTEPKKHRPSEE